MGSITRRAIAFFRHQPRHRVFQPASRPGYLRIDDPMSKIVALNGVNNPGWSHGDMVDVRLVRATAPGTPTGLTATASGTQIDLAWTAPASDGGRGVTGYRIEVSEDGSAASWSGPRRRHRQRRHELFAYRAGGRRHAALPGVGDQRRGARRSPPTATTPPSPGRPVVGRDAERADGDRRRVGPGDLRVGHHTYTAIGGEHRRRGDGDGDEERYRRDDRLSGRGRRDARRRGHLGERPSGDAGWRARTSSR